MVAHRLANVAPSWDDDAGFASEVQAGQDDDKKRGRVPMPGYQFPDTDLCRPALAAAITAEAERMSTQQVRGVVSLPRTTMWMGVSAVLVVSYSTACGSVLHAGNLTVLIWSAAWEVPTRTVRCSLAETAGIRTMIIGEN